MCVLYHKSLQDFILNLAYIEEKIRTGIFLILSSSKNMSKLPLR